MKFILILMSFFVFASCSSMSKTTRNIRVGLSKSEVMDLLGEPDDVQNYSTKEAWQYCKTNFGHYVYSIIWFDADKVTGKTSYSKPGRPASFCDANFDSIRWENAPDSVIEIRQR